MKIYSKDCFAIIMPEDNEKSNKPDCSVLSKIDCENCPFYKKKEEIKDNIFYKDSFSSEDEYNKAIDDYKHKYGNFLEK